MNKVYSEDCYIYIDPEQEPTNGSVAAVAIDGADAVMRKLFRGADTLILAPERFNPEHGDIVIKSNDHIV